MTLAAPEHHVIFDGAPNTESPTATPRCSCGAWQGVESSLDDATAQWLDDHMAAVMRELDDQASRELEG